MNSVKIAYIVFASLSEMFYILCAILSPIYITPGWYFWTVLFLIFVLAQGRSFSERLDSWDWR